VCQAQGRVTRDGAAAIQNGGHAVGGHTQSARELRCTHAKLVEFLGEMFARMDWRSCHVAVLSDNPRSRRWLARLTCRATQHRSGIDRFDQGSTRKRSGPARRGRLRQAAAPVGLERRSSSRQPSATTSHHGPAGGPEGCSVERVSVQNEVFHLGGFLRQTRTPTAAESAFRREIRFWPVFPHDGMRWSAGRLTCGHGFPNPSKTKRAKLLADYRHFSCWSELGQHVNDEPYPRH
jgi:hypothetical protein